jgi:NAD(P)-dependent dehydrogenase (short-subunit alcohol dehydrogenase family)
MVILGADRGRCCPLSLQLHALAYNLANFMRTLALPKTVEEWDTMININLNGFRRCAVAVGRHMIE